MTSILKKASYYGNSAIELGLSSSPLNDLRLMKLIKKNSNNKNVGWTGKIFDAWTDSYHSRII